MPAKPGRRAGLHKSVHLSAGKVSAGVDNPAGIGPECPGRAGRSQIRAPLHKTVHLSAGGARPERLVTRPCTFHKSVHLWSTRPCTRPHKSVHRSSQDRAPPSTRPCTFRAVTRCRASESGAAKRFKLLKRLKEEGEWDGSEERQRLARASGVLGEYRGEPVTPMNRPGFAGGSHP